VDLHSDAGFAGGIETLPFGLLIFVVGTLMVVNLWAVLDTKMAVDAASREAARAVAESDGVAFGPGGYQTLADDAAKEAMTAQKGQPVGATAQISFANQDGSTVWRPCARAAVTVTYNVGLINLPYVGGYGRVISVSSTHSELVDPYRERVDRSGKDKEGVRC
jgi:Flp pilus assembly protein TadG